MQFSNHSPPYFPRMSPTNDIIYLHEQRREFYIFTVVSLQEHPESPLVFVSFVLLCFQLSLLLRHCRIVLVVFRFLPSVISSTFELEQSIFVSFDSPLYGVTSSSIYQFQVLKSKLQLYHVYNAKNSKVIFFFITKEHSYFVNHKQCVLIMFFFGKDDILIYYVCIIHLGYEYNLNKLIIDTRT